MSSKPMCQLPKAPPLGFCLDFSLLSSHEILPLEATDVLSLVRAHPLGHIYKGRKEMLLICRKTGSYGVMKEDPSMLPPGWALSLTHRHLTRPHPWLTPFKGFSWPEWMDGVVPSHPPFSPTSRVPLPVLVMCWPPSSSSKALGMASAHRSLIPTTLFFSQLLLVC